MRSFLSAAVALTMTCGSIAAVAQTYPSQPVRIINGFAPGGNADVVARIVAQRLSEKLGQPFIVESKSGAGTVIANAYVAKAPPDGLTLLLVSGAFSTSAVVSKSITYDPVEDFAWISPLLSYPLAVVVRTDSPYRTVQDLIAAARSRPSALNYPSPGAGSLVHLAVELFNGMANVEMVHIPFRGGAEPMTQVIAGRMDVGFETLTFVQPQFASGNLRALAVTSKQRVPALPDAPTVAETLPGYEAISFLGIAAPKGTPRPIIDRLNSEIRSTVADPEIQKRFRDLGGTPWVAAPEDMKTFIAADIAKWKQVIVSRKLLIP